MNRRIFDLKELFFLSWDKSFAGCVFNFPKSPLRLCLFTAVCRIRTCETLVRWVSCDVSKKLLSMNLTRIRWPPLTLRSPAACTTGVELSLYQSECDVWFVAAAALTGLPAYPPLTCPFHPFCLFLHCSSTPSPNPFCVELCDDHIQKLKQFISPAHINTHQS